MKHNLKTLLDLTDEDLLNAQKWQIATSMMIQAKMRAPYSQSELDTGDKIKRMVGQLAGFEKELREKLVYPTNTKSVPVYDFIREILGEAEQ